MEVRLKKLLAARPSLLAKEDNTSHKFRRLFIAAGSIAALFATASTSNATSGTWKGTGLDPTSWNAGDNWTFGLPGVGDVATFDDTDPLLNSKFVTLSANATVGSIVISGTNPGTFTIQGTSKVLTFQNTGGSAITLNGAKSLTLSAAIALSNGITLENLTANNAGQLTISGAVNAGASLIRTNFLDTNGTITISGVISGTGAGIYKDGAGTLTLTGLNTNTGNTTIHNGTLVAAYAGNANLSLGTSGNVIFDNTASSTARLLFDGTSTLKQRIIVNSSSNGTFEAKDGSTVTVTTASFAGNGGAVSVGAGGTFNNTGSIIYENNNATGTGKGGAIYLGIGARLNLDNNASFKTNHAISGGAIYAEGNLLIDGGVSPYDLLFNGNTANTGSGGAIYAVSGASITGVFNNISFIGNTTTVTGGAIYAQGNLLLNATASGMLNISSNTSTSGAGAFHVNGAYNITLGGTYNNINIDSNRGYYGGAFSANNINLNATTTGSLAITSNQTSGSVGGAFYAANDLVIGGNYGGGISVLNNTSSSQGGAFYVGNNFTLNLADDTTFTATGNKSLGGNASGGFLYGSGTSGIITFNIGTGAVATIGDGSSVANATDSISAVAGVPLVKNGAGTLVLNASNTYTGGTILNAGTTQVTNNNALGTGQVSFNGNSTLTTSNTLTLANNITTASGITGTLNTTGNTTLTGQISGTGTLNKTGTTTLTLTGANNYTGALNATEGTLKVMGNSGAVSGATNIRNGATLIGTGTLGGKITIATGSTFRPGYDGNVTTGRFTTNATGSVTLEAGSTIIFSLNNTGNYSSLNLNGATLSSDKATLSLIVDNGYTPVLNDRFNLMTGAGSVSTSTFNYGGTTYGNGDTILINNASFMVNTTSGLSLTMVPEPSTYGLVSGVLLSVLAVGIRRRRSKRCHQ